MRNPTSSTNIQTLALEFIKSRDAKIFGILTERLRPGLLKYAFKYVKDRELSQDVVSETFFKILEEDKLKTYDPSFKFSTWVYRIARNEALGMLKNIYKNKSFDIYMHNRSRLLQLYNPVFINTEFIGPSKEELIKQLYDASISAINELNEPYKTVIWEREVNKKQLNDIADDLNWNLSTVKTRLRKARKDVASKIYKKYPDLVDSYYGEKHEEE